MYLQGAARIFKIKGKVWRCDMTDVVFAWKSYGDISVYAADTIEQLTELDNELKSVFSSLGLEDKYYTLDNESPDKSISVIKYRKFIAELLEDEIGNESFEIGTSFERVVGS